MFRLPALLVIIFGAMANLLQLICISLMLTGFIYCVDFLQPVTRGEHFVIVIYDAVNQFVPTKQRIPRDKKELKPQYPKKYQRHLLSNVAVGEHTE